MIDNSQIRIAFFIAVCLIGIAIFPAIYGPWLLDDINNLSPLLTLKAASISDYINIAIGNNSGPLGRPISMLSFCINHALGYFSLISLKTTNLLIHLANCVLIFFLLKTLFLIKNPINQLSPHASAALLAIIWGALPIHASTIFYVIQRMTLLATFFSILSMLFFIYAETKRSTKETTKSFIYFLLSILLFIFGVFCKESAATSIFTACFIWIFFLNKAPAHLASQKKLTLLTSLMILAALLVAYYIFDGARDYEIRSFSLKERVLTEARILVDYSIQILTPDIRSMGVFHDDVIVSKNMFAPLSTIICVFSIIAVFLISVFFSSGRLWGFSFGIFIYLSSHSLESTIFPLELYFEHRNYFASLGLIISVTSLLSITLKSSRLGFYVVTASYMLFLVLLSHLNSKTWGNEEAFLQKSASLHPQSFRAWSAYADFLASNGRFSDAVQISRKAKELSQNHKALLAIQEISHYCRFNQPVPQELIRETNQALIQKTDINPDMVINFQIAVEILSSQPQQSTCSPTSLKKLSNGITHINQSITKNYTSQIGIAHTWALHLYSARWLYEARQVRSAKEILYKSWYQPNPYLRPLIGIELVEILYRENAFEALKAVLPSVINATSDAPIQIQQRLSFIKASIEKRK